MKLFVKFLLEKGKISPTSNIAQLAEKIVCLLQQIGEYTSGRLRHFIKPYLRERCTSVSALRHACANLRFFFQLCVIHTDPDAQRVKACLGIDTLEPNMAYIIAITAAAAARVENNTQTYVPIVTYLGDDTFLVNRAEVSVSMLRGIVSKWKERVITLCKQLTGGHIVSTSTFGQPVDRNCFLYSACKESPLPKLEETLQSNLCQDGTWSKIEVMGWRQMHDEMLYLLLSLIIVTAGGPPRATEIEQAQIAGERSFHLSGKHVRRMLMTSSCPALETIMSCYANTLCAVLGISCVEARKGIPGEGSY